MLKREPEFMRELHKIREKISKRWKKMSTAEILEELHQAGKWLKSQLHSSKIKGK